MSTEIDVKGLGAHLKSELERELCVLGISDELLEDMKAGRVIKCEYCGSLMYKDTGKRPVGNPKIVWERSDDH